MKYKVYISGAITGRNLEDARADFAAAETLWNTLGIDVANPLKNGLPSSASWNEHMKADTAMLWDCDAIHLLPGWELSRGARVEYAIARESGMSIFFSNADLVTIKTFDHINAVCRREQIVRVLQIIQAIVRVMDVSFNEIQGNRRARNHFFARMVFAHECRKFMPVRNVAKLMCANGASVRHFIRKFNDEERFNPEFAKMYVNIINIITPKL